MFFTQNDYKKIEQWLSHRTIKDIEFPRVSALTGGDLFPFVQEGVNKIISAHDFFTQLPLNYYNVTSTLSLYKISFSAAIEAVPLLIRKLGLVITYLNEDGDWVTYQFIGDSLTQWNDTSYWKTLDKEIINATGWFPDQEDLVDIKIGDAKVMQFKNKLYDESKFSGLGRVYMRRYIVDLDSGDTVNLLIQDMINDSNTIYIIQYDYDLNGEEITIPENCVLWFQGGSFNNGTITLQSTAVWGVNEYSDMGDDLTISGTFKTGQIMTFSESYTLKSSTYLSDSATTTITRQTLKWWDGSEWIMLLDTADYDELYALIKSTYTAISSISTYSSTTWVSDFVDEDYQKLFTDSLVDGFVDYIKVIVDKDYVNSLVDSTSIINAITALIFQAGYYYSTTTSSPNLTDTSSYSFIGTTNTGTVSSTYPTIWYSNDGSTWTLIDQYIVPEAGYYYFATTNAASVIDIENSNTERSFPGGYIAFVSDISSDDDGNLTATTVYTDLQKYNYYLSADKPVVSLAYDDDGNLVTDTHYITIGYEIGLIALLLKGYASDAAIRLEDSSASDEYKSLVIPKIDDYGQIWKVSIDVIDEIYTYITNYLGEDDITLESLYTIIEGDEDIAAVFYRYLTEDNAASFTIASSFSRAGSFTGTYYKATFGNNNGYNHGLYWTICDEDGTIYPDYTAAIFNDLASEDSTAFTSYSNFGMTNTTTFISSDFVNHWSEPMWVANFVRSVIYFLYLANTDYYSSTFDRLMMSSIGTAFHLYGGYGYVDVYNKAYDPPTESNDLFNTQFDITGRLCGLPNYRHDVTLSIYGVKVGGINKNIYQASSAQLVAAGGTGVVDTSYVGFDILSISGYTIKITNLETSESIIVNGSLSDGGIVVSDEGVFNTSGEDISGGISSDYYTSTTDNGSYWYNSGSNIYAGSSTTPSYAAYATAFYESSDARLKNNIFNIDKEDISKVNEVQHKTFTLNSDGSSHYGVIAQALEDAGLGRLVNTNNDGYKAVDYISLLILEIEALRQRISKLENG